MPDSTAGNHATGPGVMRGVVAHASLFLVMLAVPALAGPPSSAPT